VAGDETGEGAGKGSRLLDLRPVPLAQDIGEGRVLESRCGVDSQ
jgi:hypothetical protein